MTSLDFHNNTVNINDLWYNSHKDIIEKVAIELGSVDKIDELSEKILGSKFKIKKHKDTNAPKKPKTGFMHFCDDFRPQVSKNNSNLKLGGIMKELGKIWSTYSDLEKEEYNIKYKALKIKYEEDLEEYKYKNTYNYD